MPASLVASPAKRKLTFGSLAARKSMQDWHNIPNVRDTTPWHKDAGRIKLNFFLSIIFVGMILNGYDGTLISGLQAFQAWHDDLGDPSPSLIGLLNGIGYASGLIVGPIITWIDENLGRKWGIRFYGYTILSGTVISVVAGLGNVSGYALFITGRAIIGLGLASFLMTSLVAIQEITHPRSRAMVAASWNSWYILGSVLASWVNFGSSYLTDSWGWRIPYLIQLPFALFILIAVQFVPETPRFLIDKGRVDEAFDFIVKYHGNGDRNDPLVAFEFEEMKSAIREEKIAKAERWTTILRSRSNRYRLALAALTTFLCNMSGSSIIYFYYTTVFGLVGITDPTTQTGIAAGLSIFTWFCQIAAVYVGRFVGRRSVILGVWPVLLVSLAGLCASSGVFANADEGNTSAGIATVVLVWIYLGAFNFSCPVLFSYPAEIQTYSMRSKGMLIWNTVTQFEYAYVTFVDIIALNSIGYKYYAVYIPLVVIQFVLAWRYMVETKGYTLEEISMVFDGPSASLTNVAMLQDAEQGRDDDDKGREEAK